MKTVFHIIIGLFLTLLICLLSAKNNINLFMGSADDINRATVYFKQSVLDNEVDTFIERYLPKTAAKTVEKISKQKALADFQATFGDFSQNLSTLDSLNDLVPLSVEVNFIDESAKRKFQEETFNNDLIDETVLIDKALTKYLNIQRTISGFVFSLFALSFFVCALLTSLLVKNIVYNDRQKIEIYALFGVSYKSILLKYCKALMGYFFSTAVFSMGSSLLLFNLLKFKLTASKDLAFLSERLSFLPVSQVGILLICFALAYFGGLYFVLKSEIKKTFHA